MKVYETKMRPAEKYIALVSRKCDLCGMESKSEEWDAPVYKVNETEITVVIRQKDGRSYPEGGSGNKYEIDLCPVCFKTKLVPWLISQEADIKSEEWDW